MSRRVARIRRFAAALAIGAGLSGCAAGADDSHAGLWLPFVVAVVAGLIAAAALIAVGLGRPRSPAGRIGYVVLALGVWLVIVLIGLVFVLVVNPVY